MHKSPSSTSTGGASSKLPSPGCSCHQPHHIVTLAVFIPPLAAISSHSFSPLPTQAPRTSSPPYGTAGYPNHVHGPCPRSAPLQVPFEENLLVRSAVRTLIQCRPPQLAHLPICQRVLRRSRSLCQGDPISDHPNATYVRLPFTWEEHPTPNAYSLATTRITMWNNSRCRMRIAPC